MTTASYDGGHHPDLELLTVSLTQTKRPAWSVYRGFSMCLERSCCCCAGKWKGVRLCGQMRSTWDPRYYFIKYVCAVTEARCVRQETVSTMVYRVYGSHRHIQVYIHHVKCLRVGNARLMLIPAVKPFFRICIIVFRMSLFFLPPTMPPKYFPFLNHTINRLAQLVVDLI